MIHNNISSSKGGDMFLILLKGCVLGIFMKTINELERYLEENGYSFQELSIGKHHAHEGYVIEKEKGCFNFSCTERGHKRVLKSFDKEEDLVEYSLEVINENQWARVHLLVCSYKAYEISEIENKLRERNIEYRRNDIPNYKEGKRLYRIFVFGNDIQELGDIKKEYARQKI